METRFTTLQKKEIPLLVETFQAPWIQKEDLEKKWIRYFEEQNSGKRLVILIWGEKSIIGYGSLLLLSEYPPFLEQDIPEIHDVWVSKTHRGLGLGKKLLLQLENLALEKGYRIVGLLVGLYEDYGPAQKLYFRLGYEPDGRGICYKYESVEPGQSYPVDDDLLLALTKSLIIQ